MAQSFLLQRFQNSLAPNTLAEVITAKIWTKARSHSGLGFTTTWTMGSMEVIRCYYRLWSTWSDQETENKKANGKKVVQAIVKTFPNLANRSEKNVRNNGWK